MDYALHGILQARILERVAFLFSRVSFQPKDQTQVSLIAGIFFTSWALNKYIIIKLCCIHYLDLIRIKPHNLKYKCQVIIYFSIIEKCYLGDFMFIFIISINVPKCS